MNNCKLQAIGDRVIVKPVEKNQVTTGGIVLPEGIVNNENEAVVVSVGIGRVLNNGQRTEMLVQVGDRVIIDKNYGAEIKFEGQSYYIFEHDNVLAKL